MSFQTPYSSLLLYHGLGSGKTVTVINVYNMLYNYTPKWNVFLIIPAALKNDPWLKDIKEWLKKENYEDRFKNIDKIKYWLGQKGIVGVVVGPLVRHQKSV